MVKAYTDGGWKADAGRAGRPRRGHQPGRPGGSQHGRRPRLQALAARRSPNCSRSVSSETPLPGREVARLDDVSARHVRLVRRWAAVRRGQRFKGLLEADGAGRPDSTSHHFAALPSVTPTAKPAVSPVAAKINGTVGRRRVPALRRPRRQRPDARIASASCWPTTACSSSPATRPAIPSGKALDRVRQPRPDRPRRRTRTSPAVSRSFWRIWCSGSSRLLEAGWKEVRVVTDHGWLLMPKGLPKSELPKYLTATRWRRCAVVKPIGDGGSTRLLLVLGGRCAGRLPLRHRLLHGGRGIQPRRAELAGMRRAADRHPAWRHGDGFGEDRVGSSGPACAAGSK